MGNLCCNKNRKKKKIVLLLVGLDNAGKSVTVKGLAGEALDSVVPTVGLSVVYLKYKNCSVKIFDLGGGSNIRGIWQRYFMDVHGIIFVVDSSDYDRLDEAKQALEELLTHDKISGKPMLLLANKQDRQEALDEIDLVDKLQLQHLVNSTQCPTLIESCTANQTLSSTKIDPGVQKGYHWLLNYILRNYQHLSARVEMDVKQQETKDKQIRLERLERLRAINESVDEDKIESYSDYDRKFNDSVSKQFKNSVRNHTETAIPCYNTDDNISCSSCKSFETLPQVYYDKINPCDLEERPRSAVQLVKQQLELDNTKKRHSIKPLLINKTTPINLYGVRYTRSAHDSRHKKKLFKRTLKSASVCDSFQMTTDLPNSIVHHEDSEIDRELFHLNNFQKSQKLLRLNSSFNQEEQWADRTNDISIIDI